MQEKNDKKSAGVLKKSRRFKGLALMYLISWGIIETSALEDFWADEPILLDIIEDDGSVIETKYMYSNSPFLRKDFRDKLHITDDQFRLILSQIPDAQAWVDQLPRIIKTDEHRRRLLKAVVENPRISLGGILRDGGDVHIKDGYGPCVFEFKRTASWGKSGGYGGRSVTVYRNGDVVQREYVFAVRIPKTERVIANDPELVVAIRAILRRNYNKRKNIPTTLYNGTCDGTHDVFILGLKKISAWSIRRTDPSEVKTRNPSYYEEFRENMIYENLVLDIYDEIAAEINKRVPGINMRISTNKQGPET